MRPIAWPAQGWPDTPIQARERAYESGRDSARWALAPAPERPSRGREYAAASLMQGCAAPWSVDFQRLRPASRRHARAYVFPRSLLYAFPRLRVLSIETAGAGATMKPRSAERSCQFAQAAEGGGETAEQAVVVLDVIHPGIDLEV